MTTMTADMQDTAPSAPGKTVAGGLGPCLKAALIGGLITANTTAPVLAGDDDTVRDILLGAVLGAAVVAAITTDDDDRSRRRGGYHHSLPGAGWDAHQSYIDPRDIDFRAAYPVHVFVSLDGQQQTRRQRRHHSQRRSGTGLAVRQILSALPFYARAVHSPAHADIALRVRTTDFDVDYRIVDIDREDKRYKKSRRRSGGQCGYHSRAYFEEVRLRGTARYDIGIRARIAGVGADRDRFHGRTRASYDYGRNLRAQTECGVIPTAHFPSSGVERLFHRASDTYHREARRDLRRTAYHDIAQRLTHRLAGYVDSYYAALAARKARFSR